MKPEMVVRAHQYRDTLRRLGDVAETEKRSLTEAEQVEYDTAIRALDKLSAEAAVANVNASMGLGGSPADRPSMGEELKLRGQAALGSVGNVKYGDAAETLQRVVAHGVSSDGTAPVTIEGDLVKFVDSNRYAVNGARRLPMPDNHAPTFKRPRLTQRTTVGSQASEGDVLSSQRLQTTGDVITKLTRGGVLALSEQEIDWTDPAMLGLAVQDLAESYAIDTDTVLTAAIEAAATANDATETILAATLPTSAVFVAAISAATGVAYASAKKLPDTLFVGINWFTRIQGIVDTTGRPVFNAVSPQNAGGAVPAGGFGGNVLGLNLVVDPNFSADFIGVAVSQLVEFYEQDKGLVSVNAPSTLEVQYAYRGYVAANVYNQGIATIEAV